MAGCSSTSRSPSHTPWCSLTSSISLSALPPGWADHLLGRTEHSCGLCCPPVGLPGSGTPCSQRPGQLCVCEGPLSGSPRSFWWRLCKVETMARTSPGRATSTSWVARTGIAPCPHTFPAHPACANCCANCRAAPWLTHRTLFAGPVCLRSWLSTLSQSCNSLAAPSFLLGRGRGGWGLLSLLVLLLPWFCHFRNGPSARVSAPDPFTCSSFVTQVQDLALGLVAHGPALREEKCLLISNALCLFSLVLLSCVTVKTMGLSSWWSSHRYWVEGCYEVPLRLSLLQAEQPSLWPVWCWWGTHIFSCSGAKIQNICDAVCIV